MLQQEESWVRLHLAWLLTTLATKCPAQRSIGYVLLIIPCTQRPLIDSAHCYAAVRGCAVTAILEAAPTVDNPCLLESNAEKRFSCRLVRKEVNRSIDRSCFVTTRAPRTGKMHVGGMGDSAALMAVFAEIWRPRVCESAVDPSVLHRMVSSICPVI